MRVGVGMASTVVVAGLERDPATGELMLCEIREVDVEGQLTHSRLFRHVQEVMSNPAVVQVTLSAKAE